MISLRDVGVRYRRNRKLFRKAAPDYWALRGISFDLYQGDALGILGRNGVGKSTLLRLLAGIIRPDRGQLIDSGCRTSLLSLQVGFLSHLSGRRNAILSGMLLGMKRREIEARMDAIISFAELEDFIDEPIHTYSSGMRARLGFATAFQVDPDVLLIDEVMGVGDAEFIKKSTAVMVEKIGSDRTVVLVSHNASLIRRVCNRAVWIEDGVSKAVGEKEEVLQAYEESLGSRGQGKPTVAV